MVSTDRVMPEARSTPCRSRALDSAFNKAATCQKMQTIFSP